MKLSEHLALTITAQLTPEAEYSAVVEQLAAVRPQLDNARFFDLEAAVNAYAAACLDAAFVAGWEAAKHPETIIFSQD